METLLPNRQYIVMDSLYNEFEGLSVETKKSILRQRAESFYEQAWSWYMNAITLQRQLDSGIVHASKLREHKRLILQSMEHAKIHLSSMHITDAILHDEELLPQDAEDEDLTEVDVEFEKLRGVFGSSHNVKVDGVVETKE